MADPDNLSLVTLREYVESRINAQRDYTDTRLAAIEQAIGHANASLNLRLEGMNEFRSAMKDQATRFATRQDHDVLTREIRDLRESRALLEGKASQGQVTIAWLLGGAGLLLSIIGLIMKLI